MTDELDEFNQQGETKMSDKVAKQLGSLRNNFRFIGILLTLAIILFMIRPVFLVLALLFAGLLLTILLDTLANLLKRKLHISRKVAISVILVLAILFISLGGWFAGNKIVKESTQLAKKIPKAITIIRNYLNQKEWGKSLLAFIPEADKFWSMGQGMIGELTGFFSGAVGFLSYLGFIIFTGIFMAVNPDPYKKGLIKLLPRDKKPLGREILSSIGTALRWWLIGRFISMTFVGLLTAAGLKIIGLPGVMILSTMTALLSFIPIIGPIGSFIPAALVSLATNPALIINVALVYISVQAIEGNLLTPIVQERTVSLPPVIMITSQVLLGLLMGIPGVAIATPLVLTVIIVIQKTYIQEFLGESVEVLGQHSN